MSSGVWIVNNSYCLGDGWAWGMDWQVRGNLKLGRWFKSFQFFEPPHVVLWNLGRHFVKGHAT